MVVSFVRVFALALVAIALSGAHSPAAAQVAAPADAGAALDRLPADAFSPAFLGMYRKTMEIEDEIDGAARKYGVDPQLARAVCMFESGGNADLTSAAGAHGYFQVIPSTFRLMRVPTNIEAGIKYLGQLVAQLGREDYAVAAYNGGPGRVARGRPMPLESLQYVLGVGYYRSVLKAHEPDVRAYATRLGLVRSVKGDTWTSLSSRLGVDDIGLRLYNPFLSNARLRAAGHLIAYPLEPGDDLFETDADGDVAYRTRIGDNYINLAFAFDVGVDQLREDNELWRLQQLRANTLLKISRRQGETPAAARPRPAPAPAAVAASATLASTRIHRVQRGDTLSELADRYGTSVAAIRRLNGMDRRTAIRIGERLRMPSASDAEPASYHAETTYRVRRGDNLTTIARRYGTTVAAIQRANGMARRSSLRVGERLRIPDDD